MTNETNSATQESCKWKGARGDGMAGGIYCMAFIGALIYFLQHATSFWNGVLGVLKALVWPVVVVYKLLEFLKM
jgi:hypothetical protein